MKYTLLGAMLLAPFLLLAQQHPHRCGSYDVIAAMEQQYPGTEAALNQIIHNAKQHSLQQDKRDGSRASDIIYRIPVVVHIVYTKPSENLHDSLVYSQIEVLNNAYRRDNADAANTRNEFKPFAGDAGIEFFLADLDPNGNATTGITRTSTVMPANGFDVSTDAIKKSSQGGVDAWPTDRYLNIWVGDINSGPFAAFGMVLGYAYPPVGNVPNWPPNIAPTDTTQQGVVLYHKVFGRNNPLALADPQLNQMHLGKSAVHEVGHFLGLRHIWGDPSGIFQPGSCAIDDFIADTPPAINQSGQGCDQTKNECTAACPNLPDYPDMIENYMDYSNDSCSNMFSHGQIAVMRGILGTFRSRLPQISLGTIKAPELGASTGAAVTGTGDSLVITIGATRWTPNSPYPFGFSVGDTLSNIDGTFAAGACQTITLFPGDYIVNAAGDTLYYNVGDTIVTYGDGTVSINQYVPPVGISETALQQFTLYPNPATGSVFVRMNAAANAQAVTVVNLLGETVINLPANGLSNVALDINHLVPGIYLVQVKGTNGIATQRLVVE